MNGILLVYLAINGWTDLKNKQIDLLYTYIFLGIAVVYLWSGKGQCSWMGLIPGAVLLTLSVVWKSQIGYGDGIVVMFVGWLTSPFFVLRLLTCGFTLAACVGILCCVRGKKKNMELPFVPFLLVSFVWNLCM